MHWINTYYYSTDEHGFPKDQDALLSLLDAHEKERFHRYKFDYSRWIFAIARWIAKTKLSDLHNIDLNQVCFDYGEKGKPFIADFPSAHFNISHTQTAVAVAVSSCPVGIDIERHVHRGDPWREADNFLNPHIAKKLELLPTDAEKEHAFARYWSSMEALAKLRGVGMYNVKATFGLSGLELFSDGTAQADGVQYVTTSTQQREQLSLAYEGHEPKMAHHIFNGQAFEHTPWPPYEH